MGGCSSKPKTAEFEGVLNMGEDISHDEPSVRDVDGASIGLDGGLDRIDKEPRSSEGRLENVILQEEHNDLIDTPSKGKHLWAGSVSEQESMFERQAFEHTDSNVAQSVDKEINGDAFIELQKAHEKGLKFLATASSENLREDISMITLTALGPKETPSMPVVEANIVNSLDEPYGGFHKSSEIKSGSGLPESEIFLVERYISDGLSFNHAIGKDSAVLNESVAQPRESCKEEANIRTWESVFPEGKGLQLHMIPLHEPSKNTPVLESQERALSILQPSSREESRSGTLGSDSHNMPNGAGKGLVELKSEKAVNGNVALRFVNELHQNTVIEETMGTTGARMLGIHCGQSEEEVVESTNMLHQEALGNRAMREPGNELEEVNCCFPHVNGACKLNHAEQSGKNKILPLLKDQNVKGEAIGNTNDAASSQIHGLDGGLHEEWMKAKLAPIPGSTFALADSYISHDVIEPISRNALPVKNELQNGSTTEMVSDRDWYALEKGDFKYNDPRVLVFKDPKQLDPQNNGNDVEIEKLQIVAVHDDKVFSTAEQPAKSKVQIAWGSKPGAHCVHVLDPAVLGSNHKLAQAMNALDIDDVLEKLASEFERQESLAHSNS